MTCKDCIHIDVCVMHEHYNDCEKEVAESGCDHFQDKADFVEVVRCGECKHLKVYNTNSIYAYCKKTHLAFFPFEMDTRTHYCGLGERRDK